MGIYKDKLSKYRFEIRHITIFVTVLILFQIVMAYFQKNSLGNFLEETQTWFQKYSAERLAIVTSTSMELMFENLSTQPSAAYADERKIIYSFNTIVKQQLVQRNVEDICLILVKNHKLYVIDSGQKMYAYLNNSLPEYDAESRSHAEGVNLFHAMKEKMKGAEVIYSVLKDKRTYNILVPFVPDGEYRGVMYMRISPDFSFITKEVKSNFDQEAIIYSLLIFLGLIAMFMVSSQAVKERNEAKAKLFEEHEEGLKKQIKLEKESLFTKRIYHTHHKAEKIIGFIKEDVRQMMPDNIKNVRQRVITYSNFISRIIYDMKWYDQDINTIINPMFRTDINAVLKFIVEYVFLRISSKNEMFDFNFDFDPDLPPVCINEFVVWEILEPLIQNSIDHGSKKSVLISIATKYDREKNLSYVMIRDNGVGIKGELLEVNEAGVKRLFLENESTKKLEGANSGYGCYIAYQMAVGRCGWTLDAENLEESGCMFTITIKN